MDITEFSAYRFYFIPGPFINLISKKKNQVNIYCYNFFQHHYVVSFLTSPLGYYTISWCSRLVSDWLKECVTAERASVKKIVTVVFTIYIGVVVFNIKPKK